jgi:integrase
MEGKITVQEYGERWITERRIGVRTREAYEGLFRLHLAPYLGRKLLTDVGPETIRAWRHDLLEGGRSENIAAKSYRLLRAIMNTAVNDGRIKRNPCRIKGANKEQAPARPVATVTQVFHLADAMPPRFRALVLVAAFTGLRWGELIALRRCDVSSDMGVLRVTRRLAQLNTGAYVAGPTKSAAGFRTVAMPAILLSDLRRHLDTYVVREPEALVFTGEKGAMLHRGNFHRAVRWTNSVASAGLPTGFLFHDLRHTGNHLAAATGASTRELMHRMGHGSRRAALIYQHATSQRDREIAAALSRQMEALRRSPRPEVDGQRTRDEDTDDHDDRGSAGAPVPAG